MDTLTIILLTTIVVLALAAVAPMFMEKYRNGKELPWDKIRPIILEMVIEVTQLLEVSKQSYDELESYAVRYVKEKIDEAPFLKKEEKAILTIDLIRAIIAPYLEELYKKENSTQKKAKK